MNGKPENYEEHLAMIERTQDDSLIIIVFIFAFPNAFTATGELGPFYYARRGIHIQTSPFI